MKIFDRRGRGYITVEASLIMPFVILSLAALIYMGLILYQRAQIQSVADMSAEAGAAAWRSPGADTGTGRTAGPGSENGGLYWRLADADRDEKLEKAARYAEKSLEKGRLLKPVNSNVEARIKDYLAYKKLELSVDNTYELPFGRLLRIFGASGDFRINVVSEAVIDDPVEFRRNVDFAADLEKELEDRFPGLKDMRGKTRDALTGVKGKINELFE